MDNEEQLRRLRIKAEERERVREEQLQNEDSLQALREVYGLSEAELQKLQQEVESEYAAEQASGQQRIQHRYGSWPSIKQLLFTAKGRLSRGDFWLAELGVFVVHSLIHFVYYFSSSGRPDSSTASGFLGYQGTPPLQSKRPPRVSAK